MTAETVTGSGSPEESEPTPGEGAVLTAGAGPAAVRVFPGLAAQAGAARRWARECAARPGGPDPDDIGLITAELFANAVLHTRSGSEGGTVTVAVTADGVIHVHDHGPAGPCTGLAAIPPRGGGPREDFGRGLEVITALCTGLAHMPAAWCPVIGPDDPPAGAGGCCTCCRPAAPSQVPSGTPAQEGSSLR
jgi:anti-sigma regulatory factor (Ser/Thr protein kinase)